MQDGLRDRFPVLSRGMVYLDSAAKSLTPEPVIEAVRRYYLECDANVDRSAHRAGALATGMVEETRRAVARLVNAPPDEIVFARNTTEAIGLVAAGLDWEPGDRIVTTLAEHHSNYLPWLRIAERSQVEVVAVKPEPDGYVPVEAVESAIQGGRTRLVTVTHVSNALGTIQPVEAVARAARRAGALCLVDAAQSVPHFPVNVSELGCDFLAWSGHKMFGPTGTGALWGRRELLEKLTPLLLGGGSVKDAGAGWYSLLREPPYAALEPGTPNIAGLAGFGVAAQLLGEWISQGHAARERQLVADTARRLAAIGGVTVFGPQSAERRSSVVSFAINGYQPHLAASILDEEYGIAVRSGHHCALPLMRSVLRRPEGTVRASFHLYSSEEDAAKLVDAVRAMAHQAEAAA